MDKHIFYQGLKINSAEPADERFYINSLTTEELQRVFGEDGRYGFEKAFVFNRALNKFQYLQEFISKSDVIEVSNWITIGTTLKIEVTKTQLDTLISASALIPGVTYEISGTHQSLYNDGTNSGTTIYLQALSSNILSKTGHGVFWNPKYDNTVDGFGVWSNINTWNATLTSGKFDIGETITADNGATGKLVGGLYNNSFISTGGNWSAAVSITGSSSSATATVSFITLQSYAIGSKVIWGGYSWTNVNGNVGDKTDILVLNSEWTKNPYTITDYNKAIDIIEYDYANNFISRRYEVEANNDVINTYVNHQHFNVTNGFKNSISVFMFGNKFSASLTKGIGNNTVRNSYFESVDFSGHYLYGNSVNGNSYISKNVIISYSYLKDNILDKLSSLTLNTLTSGSYIKTNTLVAGRISENVLQGSYIQTNQLIDFGSIWANELEGSYFNSNDVRSNSGIYNNRLLSNSHIDLNSVSVSSSINNNNLLGTSFIKTNTIISASHINYNDLNSTSDITANNVSANSTIGTNTMSSASNIRKNIIRDDSYLSNIMIGSSLTYNTISTSYINMSTSISSKTISKAIFENVTITSDLSTATLLYAGYSRTVYARPDNALKIRYYNNSDALVIASITT